MVRTISGVSETDEARQRFEHAVSVYQSQQWDQAADLFTELMLDPGMPADSMHELHWNLGMCFFHAGNTELARQHFEAGGYGPSDYEPVFAAQHHQDATQLFERANAAYAAADYSGASDLFAELLLHPGLPADSMREVHWNLGMCFLRMGNRELARQHFEAGGYGPSEYEHEFGDQEHGDARHLFERATSLFNGADYSEAADAFAELLIHPGLPADSMREVHWNLGMCYFHLGNDDLGRQHMAAGGYGEGDYHEAFEQVAASRTH